MPCEVSAALPHGRSVGRRHRNRMLIFPAVIVFFFLFCCCVFCFYGCWWRWRRSTFVFGGCWLPCCRGRDFRATISLPLAVLYLGASFDVYAKVPISYKSATVAGVKAALAAAQQQQQQQEHRLGAGTKAASTRRRSSNSVYRAVLGRAHLARPLQIHNNSATTVTTTAVCKLSLCHINIPDTR